MNDLSKQKTHRIPPLKVPSGIGDLIWIPKTLPLSMRFKIETAKTGANQHEKIGTRTHPLAEVLPSVIADIKEGTHSYGKGGAADRTS